MEPKFKKFNWLVKIITFNWPLAITLAPFGIYVNQKYRTLENVSKKTKNHEMIHWKQQLEMLIIFFYLWYLIEWLIRLPVNGRKAYVSLSFEQEAYGNESNYDYLKTRKPFSWFKYVNKKWGVKY
jgi:hypothetical protein